MRKIWVNIEQWNKDLVIAALECGADALVISDDYKNFVLELGNIKVVSLEGDLRVDVDVFFCKINSVEDERKVIKLSKNKIVVVECCDWTVIPLENIIVQGNGNNVIVQVDEINDAKLAFGILAKGVGGIFVKPKNSIGLRKFLSELVSSDNEIELKKAFIRLVKPVGIGDRVCVDTCTCMDVGQGMLVGNSSSFLFLMHSECIENPYVSPRPFRVNAGAVHAYVKISSDRTIYLSELYAGKSVQLVDFNGFTETAIVGRIKIEKRPLILVKAEFDGIFGTIIVQNAETIRLVSPEGDALSVVDLNPGIEVLVAIDNVGRHFGYEFGEFIKER